MKKRYTVGEAATLLNMSPQAALVPFMHVTFRRYCSRAFHAS
ncbi:hypothetical protein [uncultured Dysosmobacter sp.]|nr:hypothetical protein [uncultured Dysosmobacter sp.]